MTVSVISEGCLEMFEVQPVSGLWSWSSVSPLPRWTTLAITSCPDGSSRHAASGVTCQGKDRSGYNSPREKDICQDASGTGSVRCPWCCWDRTVRGRWTAVLLPEQWGSVPAEDPSLTGCHLPAAACLKPEAWTSSTPPTQHHHMVWENTPHLNLTPCEEDSPWTSIFSDLLQCEHADTYKHMSIFMTLNLHLFMCQYIWFNLHFLKSFFFNIVKKEFKSNKIK